MLLILLYKYFLYYKKILIIQKNHRFHSLPIKPAIFKSYRFLRIRLFQRFNLLRKRFTHPVAARTGCPVSTMLSFLRLIL